MALVILLAASARAGDGSEIAVVRVIRQGTAAQDVTQGLFVTTLGSDEMTRLYKDDSLLFKGDWSPDRRFLVLVRATVGGLGDCHLITVERDTGAVTTLLTRSFDECLLSPSWSPDGESILLQDPLNLFLYRIDTADLQQVTSFSRPGAYVEGVDWSPDGSQIVFTRQTTTGAGRLYVASATGDQRQVIHICFTRVCRAGLRTESPQWAPDGSRIAFTEARNVYLILPSGRSVDRVTHCPKTMDYQPCTAIAPTWSPASTHVAYAANGSAVAVRVSSGWVRPIGKEPVAVVYW